MLERVVVFERPDLFGFIFIVLVSVMEMRSSRSGRSETMVRFGVGGIRDMGPLLWSFLCWSLRAGSRSRTFGGWVRALDKPFHIICLVTLGVRARSINSLITIWVRVFITLWVKSSSCAFSVFLSVWVSSVVTELVCALGGAEEAYGFDFVQSVVKTLI